MAEAITRIWYERVLLDPDSFSAWCVARGLPLDAQARSQYASEVVATKHRPQP